MQLLLVLCTDLLLIVAPYFVTVCRVDLLDFKHYVGKC